MDGQQVFDSIITNGGGSFFMSDAKREHFDSTTAPDGYMVAQAGAEQIVSLDAFMVEHVAVFAHLNRTTLIHGSYLGAWVSDGNVYLDISDRFFDLAEATDVGLNNRQLAIWDVVNGTEIVL